MSKSTQIAVLVETSTTWGAKVVRGIAEFAREHGIASLGRAFTNYTPFYSYLLFAVSRFDGWIEPWHLIKTISFVFEFGCAALAARFVALDVRRVVAVTRRDELAIGVGMLRDVRVGRDDGRRHGRHVSPRRAGKATAHEQTGPAPTVRRGAA